MKWKYKIIALLAVVLIVVIAVVWLVRQVGQTEVTVSVDEKIGITPEQIVSMKSIGEWEFLSIADEELVDTTRKGMLSDDHLVRIYYGTVRLGINMHQVAPHWIRTMGDSVDVTLPKVGLLDRDFIDEARTRSFYESGKWSHSDREALYLKAYRQMLRKCLTAENLNNARQSGEKQFRQLLQSLGYEHISIQFEN